MARYDTITLPYLILALVFMPMLGVISYSRLKSGKPLSSKRWRYRRVIVGHTLLLAITLAVAKVNRVEFFERNGPPVWVWLTATAYLAFICFRLRASWARLSRERKQRARLLLPENPLEMRYWVPISFLAGFTEECAYRGLAYTLVSEITGSPGISLAVCVMAFGIAHMFQGWRGVLGASLLAVLFHLTVFLTQTLYLAIAIHVAYDLMVGVVAMRVLMHDTLVRSSEVETVS